MTQAALEAEATGLIAELERPRGGRRPVDAGAVVDCILRLEAHSLVTLAETLRALCLRDMAERGVEGEHRGEGVGRWSVARELSRVGMDEPVRRAADQLFPDIARECLKQGPEAFGEEGARWGSLSRNETKRLAEHLERHAPLLSQRYRLTPAWSLGKPRVGSRPVLAAVGVLLVLGQRSLMRALRESPEPLPFSQIEQRVKAIEAEAALPSLQLSDEAERHVRLLNAALLRRDCDSAARTWHELGAECAQGSASAQRWLARVGGLANEVCASVH